MLCIVFPLRVGRNPHQALSELVQTPYNFKCKFRCYEVLGAGLQGVVGTAAQAFMIIMSMSL
jgi:hypothetical protein